MKASRLTWFLMIAGLGLIFVLFRSYHFERRSLGNSRFERQKMALVLDQAHDRVTKRERRSSELQTGQIEIPAGINRWHQYAQKTMATQAELDDRERLSADPELHQAAISFLNRGDRKEWQLEQEQRRFVLVDFVISALNSPVSETRELAVRSVYQILGARLGDYGPTQEHELRSRIGDRIELMDAFLAKYPDKINELVMKMSDVRTLNALEWLIESTSKKQGETKRVQS